MRILLLTLGGLAAAFVIFGIVYDQWARRQKLLGAWIASTPDGGLITLQFEGTEKGGIYRQLVRRGDTQLREFGHWTRGIGLINLLIMATDVAAHTRFGQDTKYTFTWLGKGSFSMDGADRAKWVFKRASQGVVVDFDAPKTPA